jgi:hypothetical protein
VLSASDYDALRAGGLQLKLFRKRSRHHAKRSSGVHKKLNFFNTSRRTGQMALYVEQSHIQSLLKNMAIVAQPTNNATTLISLKKVTKPVECPVAQATKFGFIMNFTAAKQNGLTIPRMCWRERIGSSDDARGKRNLATTEEHQGTGDHVRLASSVATSFKASHSSGVSTAICEVSKSFLFRVMR